MPRKVLVPGRAALRFALQAADEGGRRSAEPTMELACLFRTVTGEVRDGRTASAW